MDPYSYTTADATFGPGKVGIPFDPLGEYEDHNTIYTLTVLIPEKIPGRFSQFINRRPVDYSYYESERDYRTGGSKFAPPSKPSSHALGADDLAFMKAKVVKIKATHFPPDFRCAHVQTKERKCERGCYLLERGGEDPNWKCDRVDCEGHRYSGRRKEDGEGQWCFGKKGERLICVSR